jgi:hypothetical protein
MRWSGPFGTPNVAGTELAAVIILCMIIASVILERCQRLHRVALAMPFFLMAFIAIIFLADTGSRAGTLASIVALILLLYTKSIHRYIATGATCAILAITSAGPEFIRFISPIGAMHDSSISDRVELWKGVICLIWDHPLTGIGHSNFIPTIDRWYVPLRLRGIFSTALNEPLTLAALWGLPALSAVSGFLIYLFVMGIRHAKDGSVIAAIGLSWMVIHLISGQFQGHIFAWWSERIGWSSAIILTLLSGARRGWMFRPACRWLWASVIPSLIILSLGCSINQLPWKTKFIAGEIVAMPRNSASRGMVIVYGPNEAPKAMLDRWISRRLSESTSVIMLDILPGPTWWREVSDSTHIRKFGTPLALASGEYGAKLWSAWRQCRTGSCAVLITDPDGALEKTGLTSKLENLKVRIGKGDPFIESDEISHQLSQDGMSVVLVTSDTPAMWWVD